MGTHGFLNAPRRRRPRTGGTAETRTQRVLPLTPTLLALVSIPTHRAAVGEAIPCGVTVDPCQVNSRPAGHLALIRRLGVVGTERHPLHGTGGQVGGGDVTHGVV